MHAVKSWKVNRQLLALLSLLLFALPAAAKVAVDFNPDQDFSKYKTFAFIGGVEQLVSLQLNPDLINNRVHRAVTRELVAKGLREVQANENPDLVVRYWVISDTKLNVSTNLNWGPYGPYIGSYWGYLYTSVNATSTRTGSLQIDLIDTQKKDLAWRLYLIRKITNSEKIWKQADSDIVKGFQSFPPSAKDIESKKKERQEHKPAGE
jgi:Domain of unknown function (DUF4136)